MKVAIVHEWLVSVGGSDKLVKVVAEIYPNADIFVLVSSREIIQKLGLQDHRITNSVIQKLPFAQRGFRNYLWLFPFAVEQFDLSKYDLIISSSHAVAKGVLTNPSQVHVCYNHSPMRYAWDLYHEYLRDFKLTRGIRSTIARLTLHRVRQWDVLSSFRVDHFIANSKNVADRIKKYYRRESEVVYPPIDIDKFSLVTQKEDLFVTASRLVPYKKIDLIVSAFNEMPERKLVVLGDGPQFTEIRKMAKDNITMLGFREDEIFVEYLQRAKGFVFAADEDFGMLPLEAQACGTPVIAFGKGGVLESVVENETGVFYHRQTPEALIEAINSFEGKISSFDPIRIRKHAERFSTENFKRRLKDCLDAKMGVQIGMDQ